MYVAICQSKRRILKRYKKRRDAKNRAKHHRISLGHKVRVFKISEIHKNLTGRMIIERYNEGDEKIKEIPFS